MYGFFFLNYCRVSLLFNIYWSYILRPTDLFKNIIHLPLCEFLKMLMLSMWGVDLITSTCADGLQQNFSDVYDIFFLFDGKSCSE